MELHTGDIYRPSFRQTDANITAISFGIVDTTTGNWFDFNSGQFSTTPVTQHQAMSKIGNSWFYTNGWAIPNKITQYNVEFKASYSDIGDQYYDGPIINVVIKTTYITPSSSSITTPSSTPTKIEMLQAIDAALHARFTGQPIAKYTLPDGQSVEYYPTQDLIKWRDTLRLEIASETKGSQFNLAVLKGL